MAVFITGGRWRLMGACELMLSAANGSRTHYAVCGGGAARCPLSRTLQTGSSAVAPPLFPSPFVGSFIRRFRHLGGPSYAPTCR